MLIVIVTRTCLSEDCSIDRKNERENCSSVMKLDASEILLHLIDSIVLWKNYTNLVFTGTFDFNFQLLYRK